MPKPYSLRLFTPVLSGAPSFVTDLSGVTDWRRSIRAVGGYWQGSFSLRGDRMALQRAFDEWPAYHVEERVGGAVTWEGMVYEMELTAGGIRRRRSLDLMYNAVRTSYVKIDWTGDLIANGGFETGSAGSFDGWEEGSGVETELGTVYAGSQSCKITSDGALDWSDDARVLTNTWIRQNVNVTTGERYRLTVHGYGQAKVAIRNPNTPTAWIVKPTPILGSWGTGVFEFTGPSGSEVLIVLYPGEEAGNVGYFDGVTVEERGEVVGESDWFMTGAVDANADGFLDYASTSAASPAIVRCGRREEILYLDDYPLASATAKTCAFLAENNWPWARPVSAGAPGEAVLEVRCAGYAHTMNWQFVAGGDGEEHNLSDWIATIVGTDYGLTVHHGGTSTTAGDCQFVKVGNIATNTLQVVELNTVHQRAWDTITELLELGIAGDSAAGEPQYMPARAWVDTGRLFHYQKVSRAPRYHLRGDGLYDRPGARVALSPWTVRPAVFRDMTYPVKRDAPGSFLEDVRDFWVEEVEVDATGKTIFKTSLFSEQDAMDARAGWFGPGEPVDPLAQQAPIGPIKIVVGG